MIWSRNTVVDCLAYVLESIGSTAVESLAELRTTQPISTDRVSHAEERYGFTHLRSTRAGGTPRVCLRSLIN